MLLAPLPLAAGGVLPPRTGLGLRSRRPAVACTASLLPRRSAVVPTPAVPPLRAAAAAVAAALVLHASAASCAPRPRLAAAERLTPRARPLWHYGYAAPTPWGLSPRLASSSKVRRQASSAAQLAALPRLAALTAAAADTVDVVSIDDPRIEGVTLYLSDFTRSLSAKLGSGDLFNEVRAR